LTIAYIVDAPSCLSWCRVLRALVCCCRSQFGHCWVHRRVRCRFKAADTRHYHPPGHHRVSDDRYQLASEQAPTDPALAKETVCATRTKPGQRKARCAAACRTTTIRAAGREEQTAGRVTGTSGWIGWSVRAWMGRRGSGRSDSFIRRGFIQRGPTRRRDRDDPGGRSHAPSGHPRRSGRPGSARQPGRPADGPRDAAPGPRAQ